MIEPEVLEFFLTVRHPTGEIIPDILSRPFVLNQALVDRLSKLDRNGSRLNAWGAIVAWQIHQAGAPMSDDFKRIYCTTWSQWESIRSTYGY